MYVILNDRNKFYSRISNDEIVFTTNFAKATMFECLDDAMAEWDENGTDEISVHIENV